MSTALMIEIFGYIGCIFVIISMLMTSVVKLRVINTVGSSISAVYAMIGHSYPLAVVNASLVVINIYNLIKLSKADGNHYDMIRGDKEDSYLTYFIKHYKEDMKKYFLENTLELSAADTIYIVCCEGVPAGVLAGKKEGDALEISFDYTTPTYRDCSAGRFLYAKLAEEGYKKSLSPYGMFPCSLPNDPPPLQKQAHIPFLIYQKLYFTAILHTHNTQLYFLSLLSDQFLFNAINLVCSIFITNE